MMKLEMLHILQAQVFDCINTKRLLLIFLSSVKSVYFNQFSAFYST